MPLSSICKFLCCASPKIANPQIFMINPQIANPRTTKYCTTLSQNSHKSHTFQIILLFLHNWIRALSAIFVRKKVRIHEIVEVWSHKTAWVRKSQIHKSTNQQITKPQITNVSSANRNSTKFHVHGRSVKTMWRGLFDPHTWDWLSLASYCIWRIYCWYELAN